MNKRITCGLSQSANGSDAAQQIMEALIAHGLKTADAHRLVEDELAITTTTGIKSLRELMEGRLGDGGRWIEASEESKAAAAKLAAYLRWDGTSRFQPEALTDKERELVVEHDFDVAVRADFFRRVAGYVASHDQLTAVVKLLTDHDLGGRFR